MDLKDKIIIVTGASQGIGLSTAEYLTGQGAKVVLAARSEDKLIELSKKLPDSLPIKIDMTNPDDIKKLINETLEKYGRIDILINNAGQGFYTSVENIDIDSFKKVMDLNLYSVVLAMQAVIPVMRQQGGGIIINVSSAVTKNYFPGLGAYSATKYALNAISLTARQELAPENISVSIVLPKMTSTNFMENSLGMDPEVVKSRMKGRLNDMIIDTPETVAEKIGELINSGQAELLV